MNWADILTRVSKEGSVTYSEMKAMDVREFFITVTAIEQQVKERQRWK